MTTTTNANDTIKQAHQTGITKGEKMISAKVANIGDVVEGWSINAVVDIYGTDYLFRAAVTKIGVGAILGQEEVYPVTFVDSAGKRLSGNNNYTIHFEPG